MRFKSYQSIHPSIHQYMRNISRDTGQTMKFSIKDFFTKCDHIGRKLKKKSLMENLIFCPVGTFIFSVSNQLFPVSFLIFLQVLAKIIQGKSRSVLVL